MTIPDSCPFDPHTSALISSKAARLCRWGGLPSSDQRDVAQELRLHLWRMAGRFNPARSPWLTFASYILDKRGVSLLREWAAEKRSPAREECSLNEDVIDPDGRVVDRHQTTPEAGSDERRRQELQRDMAAVLAAFPDDELRAIAIALAMGTPHSAGVELRMPRRSMPKAIEEIRELFRDAGLDQYL